MNGINKKRIAAAVAGVLMAAPVMFAQADVSTYGVVDVAYTNLDTKVDGAEESYLVGDAGTGGSRLGFAISQDLGNGLTGKGNLEAGFDNSGSGNYGDFYQMRQAWVGLAGGFGSITLGQDYTLSFLAAFRGEYCGFCGVASPAGITRQGVRQANMIKYNSPNFGGVSFGLATAFGEDGTDGDLGNMTDAAVYYSGGPVNVAASTRVTQIDDSTSADPTDTSSLTDSYLAGNVTFGIFKVYALVGAVSSSDPDIDESNLNVGLGIKVGAGDLNLQFGSTTDNENDDADTTMTAVSIFYPLGKNTTVYGQFASVKNDINASRSPYVGYSGASLGTPDETTTGMQVGLKVNF